MKLKEFLEELRRRKGKGSFVMHGYAVEQGELSIRYYCEWCEDVADWGIEAMEVVDVQIDPQYDSLGEGYEHIHVGHILSPNEVFYGMEKEDLETYCLDEEVYDVRWENWSKEVKGGNGTKIERG